MKLTIALLTIVMLQVHASGLSQTITFSGKDVPIKKVFGAIKQQTGYVVLYNQDILTTLPSATLSVYDMPLADFLVLLLKDRNISYLVNEAANEKSIILSPKDPVSRMPINNEDLVALSINTFPKKIVIVDENGTPLSGASVRNKNSKFFGVTDAKGVIDLNVEMGDVLEVTFIGYETRLHTIKDKTASQYIRMKFATNKLDEVIYTAYGKTSKRLNTGDITKVSGEDIANVPVLNPLLALEGRVPGLIISNPSGYASSPISTLLRGQLNINQGVSSEPLFVIDGVPLIVPNANGNMGATGYDQSNPISVYTPSGGISPLFMIQSLDIESIEILKDADALAVYGAQAANGAILITTKKAKAGAVSMKVTMEKGFTKAKAGTEYLNTTEYLKMRRAAFQNAGETPTIATAPDLLLWDSSRSVNWLKELYGNIGNIDNIALSVSGGQQGLTFNVGGSFSRVTEVSTVAGSTKRNIINSAINYRGLNNRLQTSLKMSLSQADVNLRTDVRDFTLPPNAPAIYDSLGNYNWVEWNMGQTGSVKRFAFPFANRELSYPSSTTVLNLNAMMRYTITNQLQLVVDVQRSSSAANVNQFIPIKSKDPTNTRVPATGAARFSSSGGSSFNVSPQLRFDRQEHWGKISLLMAFAYNSGSGWNNAMHGTGYTNDNLLESITSAAVMTGDNKRTYQKSARLFSTFNYNYLNKYIVNLSVSRDGSTKFGPGKRFGNFWSAGLAWIATDEAWVRKVLPEAFSFVKFKGSYGTTGGDGVGDYKYISQWGAGLSALKPYGGSPTIRNQQAVNPDFRWQISRKRSFSLEMGLFKDKLNLSITNYEDRMGNQLVQFPIPITSGFNDVTANSPALSSNKGWEFSISADIVKQKSFSWSLSYNIGINKNKLLKYPNLESSTYRFTYILGKPLNITPALHYTGLDPFTGNPTYMDRNNDGVINRVGTVMPGTLNDDRIWLDLTPKFFGGVQSRLSYNKWFLSFNVSYNKAMIKDRIYDALASSGTNIPQLVWDNTWKKPGDQVRFPKPTNVINAVNFSTTDASYTDAFYMSLNTISLMHQINHKALAKLKIKGASFGVNTNDLFSIALSGYYHPNAAVSGTPLVRTVSLKLDVTF